MIIQKLEIKNFRSYYGDNEFDFTDGLNLVIGGNGDGKSTLYDALDWLFHTERPIMDTQLISKKCTEELESNESDNVRVALHYEHTGKQKTLVKEFRFTKASDSTITTQNYTFTLIEGNGIERNVVDGKYFDNDLPAEVRRYTMFKGEGNLDIFQESNALGILIQTFSDVKDFEAYFKFMEYATKSAADARDRAQRNDRKNADKIRGYKSIVEREGGILDDINREIASKTEEATNFETLLKNIEANKETSELLVAVNRRIKNLTDKRADVTRSIHEDYTINLLDDMWVLMGFTDIAKAFMDKVSETDRERRKEEKEYLVEAGEKKALKKMGFTPLPVNIPGPQIMREMLDEEVCKVCGRKAEKHSKPWEFMLHKLQDYETSLKARKEEEDAIPPLYENNYIGELQRRENRLADELSDITTLRRRILDKIALNNRLHNDIKKIDENLEREYEGKKRILAQADGLSEEQLEANFKDISNWVNQQRNAEGRIRVLKGQRELHRAKLEEAQVALAKLAEGTSAEIYTKVWNVIRQIAEAFKSAKETNKRQLLQAIEDKANYYLGLLNANDFKGTIRIIEKANGQGEAVLINDDGMRIFNPNTALRTTYLMSVLFAIGSLSSERKESEFPLIFDAPTSSFTSAKELGFFNVISNLGKQVIIVTKSFLKDIGNGNVILDNELVDEIHGTVYRIEKKKPFDDKRLGTIQTVITKIK